VLGLADNTTVPALRGWLKSLRPYSFGASMVPVALAIALSVGTSPDSLALWTVPPFALSALLFHAGTNVLNDYYDFVHGVDSEDDADPTHVITRGVVDPAFMRISGHLYFMFGVVVGLPIGLIRGWGFVLAGLAGTCGAYFYTNGRFSFKYMALGDLLVFLLMGPALVVMGTWAFVGRVETAAVLATLPIALLVTAILHGNNLRNLENDRNSGITTLAGLIGARGSKALFAALLLLPSAVTSILAVHGVVPPHVLVALLTLPSAARLTYRVARERETAALSRLPVACARLHLLFGLLFVAGLLAGA
jgi:1,4-dihydroxy-2-naphthoate octaprenyltransferase